MIEVNEAKIDQFIDALLDYATTCNCCPLFGTENCKDGFDCEKVLKNWLTTP